MATRARYTNPELLEELSRREAEIYRQVQTTIGSAEEINRQLQQGGILEAYRNVYARYVELAKHHRERDIRNEALKRALFLSWYAEVEPSPFTGLADLDEEVITELYMRLNFVLEKGWFSEEFSWMLRHYARWEWIMLQYTENKLHPISNWIKAVDPEQEPLPLGKLPRGSMAGRGLMGLYFRQLGVEEEPNNQGRV